MTADVQRADPDWLYNEASGVLYGPDPEHPGLRYPFVTGVDAVIGHRLAEAMNRAAMPPSPTEVAVCPECDSSTGHWHGCGYGLPAGYRRAALASPAPAPQGGEH